MDRYMEEPYLEEIMVKYGKKDLETKLILTDKHVIFEQERGLFTKKFRPVCVVPLDDIKTYKDDVKISQKGRQITMQTKNKDISFTCENILDAKKITERIISVKTNSTALDRAAIKAKKIIKSAATVVGVMGTAAVAITKNKKTVLKAADGIKNLIKK